MAKIITDENKIKKILTRGVEDVIVKEHLEAQLKSGKELRIKYSSWPLHSVSQIKTISRSWP